MHTLLVAGRRERRRRRWANGWTATSSGRPAPRRLSRSCRLAALGVLVVATGLLGVLFTVLAFDRWHHHYVLQQRGLVATGRIVAVYQSKTPLVRVGYTTAAGEAVAANVQDLAPSTRLERGAEFRVRYDPQAPTDIVEDADVGTPVASVIVEVLVGLLLIGMAGGVAWLLWGVGPVLPMIKAEGRQR